MRKTEYRPSLFQKEPGSLSSRGIYDHIIRGDPSYQPFEAVEGQYATFPEFNNKRIHFLITEGQGEEVKGLVVCVHGIGTCMTSLNIIKDALVESGFTVLMIDLLGRGRSGFDPTQRPQNGYFFVAQVHAVLEATHILGRFPQFTMLGHSMGGAIATLFTNIYPELVSSLILIAPAGFKMNNPLVKLLKTPMLGGIIESLGPKVMGLAKVEDTVPSEYNTWSSFPQCYRTALIDQAIWHTCANPDLWLAMIVAARDFPLQDLEHEIAQVGESAKRPVLVIWGNKDTTCPFGKGTFFYQEAFRCERVLPVETPNQWRRLLLVIDNAAHAPHIEFPELSNEWIIKFLENNSEFI